MRLSISTKLPDNGKFDHRVSPVTWNNTIIPLPRRAAVTSGVPSASVAQVLSLSAASGSARTWRVTVTSFGTGMPANGPPREKAASGCGLSQLSAPPRMRPPRRSLTGTRSSSDAARRGPAKRTNTPPSSIHWASRSWASPTLPTSVRISIGSFWSRKRLTASAGRFALGDAHVGKRIERPLDVETRRQQRFRHVGDGAGDDADGAALPALVEELHRAGGALSGNLDARDIVAQFDRQIEMGLGVAIRSSESERRLAKRQALEIERAYRSALGSAGRRAQHIDAQRAGRVVGAAQRAGVRNAAG